MTALIILIIFIVLWPRIWRWLRPHVARWMQHKTEDYFRRSMGMPPRDKSRDKGRSTDRRQQNREERRGGSGRRRYSSGPIIPKEYAEDVDFTEIRSYSEETDIAEGNGEVRFRQESQVSDAEIIEIKKDKR